MFSSPRFSHVLTLTAASAAIAASLIACPTSSASATDTTVTILLKAPNQAGLDRLATAHGLSHTQRVEALSQLLPTAATHLRVIKALHAAGFAVTHETAWTIDATAGSSIVASTFGTAAASNTNPVDAARTGAALPEVPPSISSVTAAVLAKSTGPAIFRPRDHCGQCHDGHDFRNAYSSPSHVLRTGKDANGPLTIATVQFPLQGGWNEADLTSYAESVGLPDPVASGQYQQFAVDGVSVPGATTKEGGADEEVDLDQESILSTAPLANQRAYFDTNANKAGYADALSQVLADVTQGTGAMGGGDPKIAALSTSWGTCEQEFSDAFAFPQDTVSAVGNILKSLTAAGVTVFAASGDDGVYDCGDSSLSTRIDVDYPASAPEVVAVGGTRLKYVGNSSANDGTNWVDTAWSCHSAESCEGNKAADTGGSGGGESTLFSQPDYQAAGIGHQAFQTATGHKGDFGRQAHRLVPDIAANGDPQSGFKIVTTDPTDVPSCAGPLVPLTCKPGVFVVGGTSLSAPIAAAMFTDMLSEHDLTAGVGDIHDALYAAYAGGDGTFRDISKGENGDQKDVDTQATKNRASELPVDAQPGYDTVTGLGAVLWPALAPYLFHPVAPDATGTIGLLTPHSRSHAADVTAQWAPKYAKKGATLATNAAVTITKTGSSTPLYSEESAPASGSTTFAGKPGATYTLTVLEQNDANQPSAPATTSTAVPYDDSRFAYHGSWSRVAGKTDFGGSREVSDHTGNTARVTATGSTYTLEVRTGPTYGKLAAFQGGKKLGVYDLYSAKTHHKLLTFFGDDSAPPKSRTFTFYVAGKKNPLSTGYAIDIDALIR